MIIGFITALFEALKAQKARKTAPNGFEASIIINHEIITRNNEIYLMKCLALTYEEKANFNNKLFENNAILFNKVLHKLKYFFIFSVPFMFLGLFLGLFSLEIWLSLASKIMVLVYHPW